MSKRTIHSILKGGPFIIIRLKNHLEKVETRSNLNILKRLVV